MKLPGLAGGHKKKQATSISAVLWYLLKLKLIITIPVITS